MNNNKKYNEEYIVNQYLSGRTAKDIGIELGTYNTSVRRILIRNGIIPRTPSEAQRIVKVNPFLENNEETDYWLGWLATDGCLTNKNIILQLQERDIEILEKFKEFLGGEVNITSQYNKKYNIYEWSVRFKNPEIYKFLIEKGITERKSKTLKINQEISWPMLRGIFEGDGCIIKHKSQNSGRFMICSASIEFINQISSFLSRNGLFPKITLTNNKTLYNIGIYKQQELIKLYNNLYPLENLNFLSRKKKKFEEILLTFYNLETKEYFGQKWRTLRKISPENRKKLIERRKNHIVKEFLLKQKLK